MKFLRQAYTPEEVAAMLGLSLSTIYRRLEDGSLPSLERLGKPYRIPIEEFHRKFPELRPPLQLSLPFGSQRAS